ncbi:MAG: hypothetical protein WAQ75_12300, partial [Propionicimonas sp.]
SQPTTCDAIQAALVAANQAEPTATPTAEATQTSPAATATQEGSATPTPTAATSASATPTASTEPEATQSDAGEASPSAAASTAPSAAASTEDSQEDPEQLAAFTVDDITLEQIKACGEARAALATANAVLADYYHQLVTTGTIVTADEAGGSTATPTPTASASASASASTGAASGSSASSSSSSTTSVSARAVAAATADLLSAEQDVTTAETNLAGAELLAPLDGTVGALSLEEGGSASSGSVTIVGEGTAVVSIEVPLATRTLLKQGMAVEVTAAGSSTVLAGSISRINILETSGTSGDSPTYTTLVVVKDPDQLLNEGAKAAVSIALRTASDVVVVPGSAVTPTGDGAATVQIVDNASDDSAETVQVTTGAVGGGRVEITGGITAGQLVVLSDRTAEIPSNTSQRRTTSGSTVR